MTRKPALTSRLLGLAFGLLAWAAPLQAKEAETHALDGLKALKLSGGLTFEVKRIQLPSPALMPARLKHP